ncbi:MAG: aspartate 1-decarboxylase [Planctomycetes bacterium]|nr:aspartate 1-decarboxylase [Planctomycetota bacterium]
MMREMFKSKIHNAVVTEANLHYTGSITIDTNLLEASDILPGEKVLVVNKNTGARFETYTFPGTPGGGQVCLNGAAARLATPGDQLIVISFALMTEEEARQHHPKIVFCAAKNAIEKTVRG